MEAAYILLAIVLTVVLLLGLFLWGYSLGLDRARRDMEKILDRMKRNEEVSRYGKEQ